MWIRNKYFTPQKKFLNPPSKAFIRKVTIEYLVVGILNWSLPLTFLFSPPANINISPPPLLELGHMLVTLLKSQHLDYCKLWTIWSCSWNGLQSMNNQTLFVRRTFRTNLQEFKTILNFQCIKHDIGEIPHFEISGSHQYARFVSLTCEY